MNYTRRGSSLLTNDFIYKEVSHGKKKRPLPQAERRKMFMAKGNQPSFLCPDCRVRFQLAYGDPCKRGVFGDSPFYCKDCQHADPTLHRSG